MDPNQDHDERFGYGVLAAISDADSNGSIGFRNFRRKKHHSFLLVDWVDTKWLQIHVVKVLHHVVDAPISVPSDRSFGDKKGGRRIPHQLPDGKQVMTVLCVNQVLVKVFDFLVFVVTAGADVGT